MSATPTFRAGHSTRDGACQFCDGPRDAAGDRVAHAVVVVSSTAAMRTDARFCAACLRGLVAGAAVAAAEDGTAIAVDVLRSIRETLRMVLPGDVGGTPVRQLEVTQAAVVEAYELADGAT